MKWMTEQPSKVIQHCLITWQREDGTRFVTLNAICPNENRHRLIAYMPITHFLDDKTAWKSQFIGDEEPSVNGRYLCCKEKSKSIFLYWYDANKCTFGGADDMIAYMPVPKPYAGDQRLKLAN